MSRASTNVERNARAAAGKPQGNSAQNSDSGLVGTLVTGRARPTRTGAGRPRQDFPPNFVSNLDSTLENGGTIEAKDVTQAQVSRLRNTLLDNYKKDKEAAGQNIKTPIRCTRGKLKTAKETGTDTVTVEYWAEPVPAASE